MAKIKAPLFSLDASGTLDKTLTYRKKPQNNTASKYAKPGSVNPFESSPRQKDQRSIIGLITACWQSKTSLDKLSWDASAKADRFKGSGYHYFLHLAKTDLKTYLGLVGFWSMNYNIGDKVPDLSGQNNHGTLSPIYPCDCPQPVDSNNKKNGKAYLFNGSTNSVNCGTDWSLNVTNSTFELILKYLPGGIGIHTLFARYVYTNHGYFAYVSSTNRRVHLFSIYSGANPTYISNYIVPLNEFILLTITVNHVSQKIRFYFNGVFDVERSVVTNWDTGPGVFVFGGVAGVHMINAIIDNLSVYNRVLTDQEIQRHSSLFI